MAKSDSGGSEPIREDGDELSRERCVDNGNAGVRYDRSKSYRWNYDHPPDLANEQNLATQQDLSIEQVLASEQVSSRQSKDLHRQEDVPVTDESGSRWDFLGIPVASPLGIAAGPLLNSAWCLYYGARGFDVLTYKTVRSSARECYAMPNLVPVKDSTMQGGEASVHRSDRMGGSWAVSFGMPSSSPEVWRRDVEFARANLRSDQVLSVSIVGTQQDGWGLSELADDYAQCAFWAAQSGADVIEANFSCPNVTTCDGQLYQNPDQSKLVASEIRRRIGAVPLVIKIGFQPDFQSATELIRSLDNVVDGLSMTNSLASRVTDFDGSFLFGGEHRGICGDAIFQASRDQVSRFSKAVAEVGSSIKLIGVGGIRTTEQVRSYLSAGASACHLATSIMTDPEIGFRLSSSLRTSA